MRKGIPITLEATFDSDELLLKLVQSRGLDKCVEVMMKYYQKPLTNDQHLAMIDVRDSVVKLVRGENK